ncbi:serpin family protein [Tenacibaculum amylolyticum]|uniref:serpin family protein n=1 Tax=Tenacibaculum amylolyticum TaxID=104269 RepID=UPI0038950B18
MKDYVLTLLKILNSKEKNVIISPYCFEIAFTILSEGMVGKSKKEILRLLEINERSLDLSSKSYKDLTNRKEGVLFDIKNEISHNNELELKKSYRNRITSNFPLKIISEGFNDLSGNFSIKSVFSLEAFWLETFYELSRPEVFTLPSGNEMDTLYLCQSNIYGENNTKYLKADTYEAIQLPLKGKEINIEIYLPNDYDGLEAFVSHLETDFFQNQKFKNVDAIKVVLPKFKSNHKLNLKDYKEELKVHQVFEASYDYCNLFEGNEFVHITKIKQDNELELNEKGVKGKSTTAIGGIAGGISSPKEHIYFEASHSFLYVIRDRVSEDVFFIGTVDEPKLFDDISLIFYNEREYKIYKDNKKEITNVTSLLLALFVLNRIKYLLEVNNMFVDWFELTLWKIIKDFSEGKESKLLGVISSIDVHNMKIKGVNDEVKKSFEEFFQAKFSLLNNVINQLIFKYKFSDNNDVDYVIGLVSDLKERNIQLPSFELVKKYELGLPKEGCNIQKKADFFLVRPLPKITLTEKEIKQKKQRKKARRFLSTILNMNLRGLIYFGVISLEKIIKKHKYQIKELTPWINELKKIIITDIKIEEVKEILEELEVGFDEQTGFYSSSRFLSKDKHEEIIEKYIEIKEILNILSGLFWTVKWSNNDSRKSLPGEIIYSCESIFDELIEQNIDIEFFEDLKKHRIRNGNVLGSPIGL